MIKKLLIHWLPLIALLIIGIIMGDVIFGKMFTPFSAQIIGERGELMADGQKICYADVDDNGNSEEFIYYHLSDNRQPVINQYSSTGKFQNLWSLDGEVFEQFEFMVGDYDNNKQKEVYVFAMEKNILYLYGIKPFHSNEFIFEKVKICTINNQEANRFVVVRPGGVFDMDNDGFGDLVFSVNSRYNPKPRKVYCYNIKINKLIESEDIGMQLVGNPIVYDVDNDQLPEIFLATLNSTNQAWLSPNADALHSLGLLLDNNLKIKGKSLKFKNRMSVTATYPWTGPNDTALVSVSWPLKQGERGQVVLCNSHGDTLGYRKFKNKTFVFDPIRKDWDRCILFTHSGEIINLDNELNMKIIRSLKAKINHVEFVDILGDGKDEVVVMLDNTLAIFDSGFKHGSFVEFPGLGVENATLSIKESFKDGNNLSIQNGKYQYLVSYKENKNYALRYWVYIALGLMLAALYYIAMRIYHFKIDRIKQSNKEVMGLQIELMKNQLDPHFLFNALNSISYSINKNDRKTAYYNLGVFSKLMRESISSMEELNRTLEEEINYTSHYLHLEKFRFKEQFEFNFIVSPEVAKSTMVPKMCLFCYVESALKKGVLASEAGGTIEIKIDYGADRTLILSIRDNGLHRNVEGLQSRISNSIAALNHIIAYYNSFNKSEIDISYADLGTTAEPHGSLITLNIPNDYYYNQS